MKPMSKEKIVLTQLFTLPQNSPWKMLPGWHTDAPRQPHAENSGVQMFTFLDAVQSIPNVALLHLQPRSYQVMKFLTNRSVYYD